MSLLSITIPTTIIGAIVMLFGSTFIGFLVMIGGLFLGVIFANDLDYDTGSSRNYTTYVGPSEDEDEDEEDEPYYKSEFEKYQHYKIVKRNMKK